MKRERTVFGRRRFVVDGEIYNVSLKRNGLWIRKLHARQEFLIPMKHLLRLANRQTEMFPVSELGKPQTEEAHHEEESACIETAFSK